MSWQPPSSPADFGCPPSPSHAPSPVHFGGIFADALSANRQQLTAKSQQPIAALSANRKPPTALPVKP